MTWKCPSTSKPHARPSFNSPCETRSPIFPSPHPMPAAMNSAAAPSKSKSKRHARFKPKSPKRPASLRPSRLRPNRSPLPARASPSKSPSRFRASRRQPFLSSSFPSPKCNNPKRNPHRRRRSPRPKCKSPSSLPRLSPSSPEISRTHRRPAPSPPSFLFCAKARPMPNRSTSTRASTPPNCHRSSFQLSP